MRSPVITTSSSSSLSIVIISWPSCMESLLSRCGGGPERCDERRGCELGGSVSSVRSITVLEDWCCNEGCNEGIGSRLCAMFSGGLLLEWSCCCPALGGMLKMDVDANVLGFGSGCGEEAMKGFWSRRGCRSCDIWSKFR